MEVQTPQGGCFAEVCDEGPYPQSEELRQLLLIPVFGLWIAEIEDGVVYRRFAISAPNNVVSLYSLPVQVVAWVEVRKLPQTKAKPLLLEIGDHFRGLRVARLRKLEVATVRHLEPSSVYVDHVCGELVL